MKVKDTDIIIKQGDITEQRTSAIVNAANNEFSMGGGLAKVIRERGGKAIEEEAIKLGPKEVGESVVTSAGKLQAKYVIHASTMAMDFKTDEFKIRKAAATALKRAQEYKMSSLSFCALGCGVGKFPYKDCAKVMSQEVFRYLRETTSPSLKKIVFVLKSRQVYEIFKKQVLSYLEHLMRKVSQGPFLTVDGVVEYGQGIVLVKRLNPPFGWALPGGFVDYGETVEEAVKREIKEEINLDFVDFKQLKVYSNPLRDPRFHTVSVVFKGIGKGKLQAASDAKEAEVFKLDFLPEHIAFDHRQIIDDYIKKFKT